MELSLPLLDPSPSQVSSSPEVEFPEDPPDRVELDRPPVVVCELVVKVEFDAPLPLELESSSSSQVSSSCPEELES